MPVCRCLARKRCKLIRRRGSDSQGRIMIVCGHFIYGKCAAKWALLRQPEIGKPGVLPCGCGVNYSIGSLDRLACELWTQFGRTIETGDEDEDAKVPFEDT